MELEDGLWHARLPEQDGATIEYFITAQDVLGNVASAATADDPYLIQTAGSFPSIDVRRPDDGEVITWDHRPPSILVEVAIDGTGIDPTYSTKGKALLWTSPSGDQHREQLRSRWLQADCDENQTERCEGLRDEFFLEVPVDEVGRWNFTVSVLDADDEVRRVPFHVDVRDEPPVLRNRTLTNPVELGQPVHVAVTAADEPAFGVDAVEMVLRDADDDVVATARLEPTDADLPAGTSRWAGTVPTGDGAGLSQSGDYTWILRARDENGHVAEVGGTLTVQPKVPDPPAVPHCEEDPEDCIVTPSGRLPLRELPSSNVLFLGRDRAERVREFRPLSPGSLTV